MDAGWRSAAGASAATSAAAAASTVTVNLTADRPPSRVATRTAMMARAGQAVYFIAHATPRTSAARTVSVHRARPSSGRRLRASSASARQVSAITGGSVIPIVSGNAMTGHAQPERGISEGVAPSPSAARPERDPERRVQQQERPGDQPGPRLTRPAQRPRQPEERHDREVRVVGEPAAGGQRRERQVRGAVMQQQPPGPGHDRDIRGSGLPGHQPEGRRGQCPRQAAASASRPPHARPGARTVIAAARA